MIKLDYQIRENKILYLTLRAPISLSVRKESLLNIKESGVSHNAYSVRTFLIAPEESSILEKFYNYGLKLENVRQTKEIEGSS